MTDSTKTLLGTIAGLLALVATFAIMSDCSKHVADAEGNPKKICAEAGGWWLDSLSPGEVGHCVKDSK